MFHANPRMKKQLDSVVRKILEDVEFAEVQDYPEFVDLEFSVDIMEPGNSSEINAEGLAFTVPSEPSRPERPSPTEFLNASRFVRPPSSIARNFEFLVGGERD